MGNIKKKWPVIIAIICLGGISIPITWQTIKMNGPSRLFSSSVTQPSPEDTVPKVARAVTVKIFSQEFLGSGILIQKHNSTYQVLTNAHVLDFGQSPYQIQTSDGKIHPSVMKLNSASFEGNDLAILEFTSENDYQIAKLKDEIRPGENVTASGFPSVNLTRQEKSEIFVLKPGKIVQLLDKPLEGGYQIGYTNDIEKGMSGGPLFNEDGEVVAVNGMHAYPLWGDPYIYKDGSRPEENLSEQMSQYSWGIPVNKLMQKLSEK